MEKVSNILLQEVKESNDWISEIENIPVIGIVVFAVLLLVIFGLVFYVCNLNKKSNQLKKDKQFIFNIQETERGKISRDIHDFIIQDLRAIRIKTELLNVSKESDSDKNEVVKLVTDCVVKLRNICYNLTPAELVTHEDGDNSKIELVSIIQSLVLQFIERTHVPCQVKIDENFEYPVLDKDITQNLFRIIQEALTNIEKHSYATNCQILIRNKIINNEKHMFIFITDDGVGCEIKSLLKRRGKLHFGLQNMVDRGKLIGATVEFESELGSGFEVSILI